MGWSNLVKGANVYLATDANGKDRAEKDVMFKNIALLVVKLHVDIIVDFFPGLQFDCDRDHF